MSGARTTPRLAQFIEVFNSVDPIVHIFDRKSKLWSRQEKLCQNKVKFWAKIEMIKNRIFAQKLKIGQEK